MMDTMRMIDNYDRLALCTESLGFESFDGRMDLNGADELALLNAGEETTTATPRPQLRSMSCRREEHKAKFPPPLTWLTGRAGRRSHFMKAVKKDGRLLLTEVRIEQPPEIFRSSRQDGRLRMQLIRNREEEVAEEEAERWELPRGLQRCHELVTRSNPQFWPSHHYMMPA